MAQIKTTNNIATQDEQQRFKRRERDANWKCNDDEGDIKRKGECPFG